MATSAGRRDGEFGDYTSDVEFRAKSNWIMMRGNRYQVLEGEFYRFVLEPHDALLRDIYGVSAEDIAVGFQDIADAVRAGQANALELIMRQFDDAQTFAEASSKTLEEATPVWFEQHATNRTAAATAFDDIFRGGICNVSRHTNLPPTLLEDLAFKRGEEAEFYAEGPYAGTPFRTLPARKKPLIQIESDYYGVDPCFTRDAGYRALLYNLLKRRPEYRKEFETKQKSMSEAAFFEILDVQLKGAKINQEVWYKHPVTRQWVENDTLIRIDDVLFLVEAKAGAAATIASPAVDFPRHVQAVQDLVVKAYNQCKRFFEYLNSADEVPIFVRKDGKYVECDRIRLADYRLLFPIGLTVESFSPFSAMCKELPDIVPLLGKHAFLSLSIDDLFVLKRFLPTTGELSHYLEVRQAIAGMKGALLFDEIDHLGGYIKKNRFDLDIADQKTRDNPTMTIWNGWDDVVNRHFEGEDWETRKIPTQEFPDEVLRLLIAIDQTRAPGWLAVESLIRTYGEDGRKDLANLLFKCRATLDKHNSRYFMLAGKPSLFVWLQKSSTDFDMQAVTNKAAAAALSANSASTVFIFAAADAVGGYGRAFSFPVDVPVAQTPENATIFNEADRMRSRHMPLT